MKSIKNGNKVTLESNFIKKIKYVLSWNGTKPGQLFDNESYVGNILSIVVFFSMICIGGYIDDIGRWIWHQYGEELIVSPGKEAWHKVVARTIGVVGIIFSLINMQSIYANRKKNALPLSPIENPPVSVQVDAADPTNVVTKESPEGRANDPSKSN